MRAVEPEAVEPVGLAGHQKGRGTKGRIHRNFGQPRPEGYRKALRIMRLAEKFGRFYPTDAAKRYETLQWLMFQMGGIGPNFGQAHHFLGYSAEKIPYAMDRYRNEANRLYNVLDKRLGDNEYLSGGEYSIADIASWPWAVTHKWSGIDISGLDHLQAWLERFSAVEDFRLKLKKFESGPDGPSSTRKMPSKLVSQKYPRRSWIPWKI